MSAPSFGPSEEALEQVEALLVASFPLLEAVTLPKDPSVAENFNRGMVLLDLAQAMASRAVIASRKGGRS